MPIGKKKNSQFPVLFVAKFGDYWVKEYSKKRNYFPPRSTADCSGWKGTLLGRKRSCGSDLMAAIYFNFADEAAAATLHLGQPIADSVLG